MIQLLAHAAHRRLLFSTCGALVGAASAIGQCTSVVASTTAGDHLGFALACIGDVDGDGANDIAIGAPQANNPPNLTGQFAPGYVLIVSGRTGATIRRVDSPAGSVSRGMFGFCIAAFCDSNGDSLPDRSGDIDGDGVPDFVVGEPTQSTTRADVGRVYVVSGATGATTIVSNPATSPSASEHFGHSITCVGNVAGDSRPEFAVGVPGHDISGSSNVGRIDLFGWVAGSTTPVALLPRVGTTSNEAMGFAIRGIGAVHGGAVCIQSLSSGQNRLDLVDAAFPAAPLIATLPLSFDAAVGGVGDVTGDGLPDFVVGGNECSTCPSNSDDLAAVWSWPASAGAPSVVAAIKRPRFLGATNLQAQRAVASCGDIDGDGIPDVAIGVPLADPQGVAANHSNAGEVRCYSGASLRTGTPQLLGVYDGRALEQFGTTVAGIGDVDGDGIGDLAVGASEANAARGRVVIMRFLARAAQQGSGCALASIATAPELHLLADSGPCAGTSVELTATQIPANRLCVLVLGSAPVAAPIPGSGCLLLVAPTDTFFLVSGPDTTATTTLTVPTSPAYRGLQVFAQYGVFDSTSIGSLGTSARVRLVL